MARGAASVDLGTAGLFSLAVHTTIGFALVALVRLVSTTDPLPSEAVAPPDDPPPGESIVIELPQVAEPSPLVAEQRDPESEVVPPRPAGASDPRPDMGIRGRGGDLDVSERALNLADRDDRISLERSVVSRLDRSQLARIKAGTERRSREDWRASRDPMEVTFFVMGTDGLAQERLEKSSTDPLGAHALAQRDLAGAALLGASFEPASMAVGTGEEARIPKPEGGEHVGGHITSTGQGVRFGDRSADASRSAKLADGRPDVDRSTPSVFANDQGRPSDTSDAEQEQASLLQKIVHASTAGGKAGSGRGGEPGPGAPGSGGQKGAGSISSPMGSGGSGPPDPAESARIGYIRAVQSKVQPLWANAFPRWATLEGRGGTATVSFVIDAKGNVTAASVSRPSGIPEFDENVKKAVLKGAPYGPLPAGLLPQLRMSIPFTAKNPIVRPKDPKEGIAD